LYLQLLVRGAPDKREEYIQTLQREVGRLDKMIEDLLDLSQLERDKTDLALATIDLNDVLQQASTAQQPRAETAGLALTFEPAARLPPVRGDLNRLMQVVTNLIANAINYTPAGAVHVRTVQGDDRVGFEVQDSGMGITPEDLPHLFERFYRGQRASRSSVRGTGLGLNIAKEIVDWHGGHIEVESQVGEGSTFRVWLPMAA
jgi:two-component system phosphate regulon sensor histidine kinase PhoR